LNEQFAYFLSLKLDGTFFYEARKLKPALIWSQVDDPDLADLAKVLVQVHSNPSGAVGGERNHKTNNRVRNKQRVRLGEENCQRQVAIAYNSAQLERTLGKRGSDPFVSHLANLGLLPPTDNEDSAQQESEYDVLIEEDEFRMVDNPTAILDAYLPDNDNDFDEIVLEHGTLSQLTPIS